MSLKQRAVYFFMPAGLTRSQQIGRLVAASRKLANITQGELAERLNSHQTVISRIENGTCVPDVQLVGDIAKAVGQDFRIFEV